MSDTSPPSRVQRRARTRATILDAARHEFAQRGYQKATIRAVAGRAGCDPSLVIQHFGSKQQLFRTATELDLDMAVVAEGPADGLSERLVRVVFEHMDERPEAAASTLRSILTHDESAEEALKLFNQDGLIETAAMAGAPDDELARLHSQLIGALTLGVAIARYVLKFSVVEQVGVDDLVASLRPAVEALLPDSGQRSDQEAAGRSGAPGVLTS